MFFAFSVASVHTYPTFYRGGVYGGRVSIASQEISVVEEFSKMQPENQVWTLQGPIWTIHGRSNGEVWSNFLCDYSLYLNDFKIWTLWTILTPLFIGGGINREI